MTSPKGYFFSTQDADSEGVEGKFFVWSTAEVEQVLGKAAADVLGYVYDISPEGNWEGHNILNRSKTLEQDARMLKIAEADLRGILIEGRRKLYEVRGRRVAPGRDEKALTSWNGLMIGAMAQAARALDVGAFAETAAHAADFILKEMRTSSGRLLRTFSAGSAPKLNAYLEDYSFLIDGLVSLYEATFHPRWIEAALALAEVMIDQHWDPDGGGFFYTGRDHERLIARTKDPHDSSVPSGNSLAVLSLLRLHKLTGQSDLLQKAEVTLRLFQGLMAESPYVSGQMLIALDFYLGPVAELAVVGDPAAADTRRVLRSIFGQLRPNKVVAMKSTVGENQPADAVLALLAGKSAGAEVTTYICENFACQAPLVGAAAAEAVLNKS
jgi:uncharacterized protein YyaL (SSP411 family)